MRTLKAFCWIFGCLGSICSAIDLLDITIYGHVAGLPQQQIAAGDRVLGGILVAFAVVFGIGVTIRVRAPTMAELVNAVLDDPRCALCNSTGVMPCFACQGAGRGSPAGTPYLPCATCRGTGTLPCTSFKHQRASHSALLP